MRGWIPRITRATDWEYPSTAEVALLSFVTVWYETPRDPRHEGFLQAARWTLVYPGAGE
jgi:hypothetical protein